MAGGVASRAEFPKLMEPTLAKAFFLEYGKGGSVYDKYWDVQDSIKAKEEIAETVIPSEVPVVGEGGMYARGELRMGRSQTWVHVTRKLELVQTEEVVEDNLYPSALRAQKALAIAMKRTIEKISAKTFSEGLTSETTPDGKTVFAPDHPVLYPTGTNPTSWSNVLANRDFSSQLIKDLKTLGRKQRDENGDLIECEMTQLIVGPDLGEEAREMYTSPGKFDSADRASNQTAKGIREVIEVPHFLDAQHAYTSTAIFMRDPDQAGNIFFWRVRPSYKVIYEESTGNVVHRVRCRFSLKFGHPRGVVAAYGAAA